MGATVSVWDCESHVKGFGDPGLMVGGRYDKAPQAEMLGPTKVN